MKLSDVKEQIDAYFNSVSPDELIERFKEAGIELGNIIENQEDLDQESSDIVDKYFWELI